MIRAVMISYTFGIVFLLFADLWKQNRWRLELSGDTKGGIAAALEWLVDVYGLALKRPRAGSTSKIIRALTIVPPRANTTPSGLAIPCVP